MGTSAPIKDQKRLKKFNGGSTRGKKFSTTLSDPARIFSTDLWLICPDPHAGEKCLL
jgi:hypothetical protein